jgi:hypothetical protein
MSKVLERTPLPMGILANPDGIPGTPITTKETNKKKKQE